MTFQQKMSKQFKIRASQEAKIHGKTGILKTGKTYINEWCKDKYFNRYTELKSKYLKKGIEKEDEAIEMVCDVLDLGMVFKNDKFFENEYAVGTPDIIVKDFIIDTKCSWNHSTFPLFKHDIDPLYYAQGQVYMWLTGIHKYKLAYCLVDTPQNLIESEAWYKCKEMGLDEIDDDIYTKTMNQMTYDDIPKEKRVKIFDFDFDPLYIETLKERVLESREYIKTLEL